MKRLLCLCNLVSLYFTEIPLGFIKLCLVYSLHSLPLLMLDKTVGWGGEGGHVRRSLRTTALNKEKSPFCLWLSSMQLESPYRAMRPPPSDGVWYSPRIGTLSTTAVSCFNTSRPVKRANRRAHTLWRYI